MTENIQENKSYRVVNIITPSVSTAKALEIMNANLILKDTEKMIHQNVSMKNFAYSIFRHNSGHYIVSDIEASKETIKELNEKMRLNENFLRTVILSQGKNFDLDEAFVKRLASYTTRRGRIIFQSGRRHNRITRKNIENHIKIARILGLLPFCNYN